MEEANFATKAAKNFKKATLRDVFGDMI